MWSLSYKHNTKWETPCYVKKKKISGIVIVYIHLVLVRVLMKDVVLFGIKYNLLIYWIKWSYLSNLLKKWLFVICIICKQIK